MNSALEFAQQALDDLPWSSLSFGILLAAVTGTLIILWRRYLSRRMLMSRIAELESLSAAGRAIVVAELDVDALCELIAQETGRIIDSATLQIGLFEQQRFYKILYWTVNGRRQDTPATFDLSENGGLVGWVRDTQKPLLVSDFDRQMASLPARPSYISQTPPRSALFIPLVSGEEAIGLLAAQSDRPERFNEEDLRRLLILANQAAAAIANARLFEQERKRAMHLELVGKIARQVNATQDIDQIFELVVALTRETFDFHPVNICGIDPETGDLVMEASSLGPIPRHAVRLASNQGLIGTAAAERQTIVCNNTADDPRFIRYLDNLPQDDTNQTRAEIAIPMLVDNRVLGVLDVQSNQLSAFGETEQTVLEALAEEVGSGIHKAQQLAWQQGQAWITTAQLQVAEAISRSVDVDETTTAVVRLTPMLVGTTFCGILIWNSEFEVYQGAAFYADEAPADAVQGLELRIGDWGALDAVHVGHEALTTRNIPAWLKASCGGSNPAIDCVQVIPLPGSRPGSIQGVMLVDEFAPRRLFNDGQRPGARRGDLLANIAKQTGQAIESARLRQAQQEEAWVNTALLQVAEAVNSLIDLNEILDTIVRLTPLLVGLESIIILFWDGDQGVFVAGPSHGISTMGRGLIETLEISADEFRKMMPGALVLEGGPTTAFALRVPDWLQQVFGTAAVQALPLNAQGRMVGMMLVGVTQSTGRRLTGRRLNILNGIAQQAATAVINNQLYHESAERMRLQQELDVAHEIQASLLPVGNPRIPGCRVASLWQAARQVSGDFYDFVPRPDGTWGIVIADVADKGVPAALFMALSRTILRTVAFNRTSPADVLVRTNEIIDREAQSDLFVTVFYATWDAAAGTLTYANGGHNPPLLMRANGATGMLAKPGIALGVLPDIALENGRVQLQPGDTLVLYTDGVTEAMNEDYDEFGVERLEQAVRATRGQPATAVLEYIRERVRDHAGGTPQFDDITLVVVQRTDD